MILKIHLLLSFQIEFRRESIFLMYTASYLTHFTPLISFDTPRKHQKTSGSLMFSGDIKRDQWHEWVNIYYSW